MIDPSGSGKTMLAKRLSSILAPPVLMKPSTQPPNSPRSAPSVPPSRPLRCRTHRRRHRSASPAKSPSLTTASCSSTNCPRFPANSSKSEPLPCGYLNDKSRERLCAPLMIQCYVDENLRSAPRSLRYPYRPLNIRSCAESRRVPVVGAMGRSTALRTAVIGLESKSTL